VRQQTAGDGTPASVTVENGSISNGAVGVLFDNDGGSLSLTGLQIEGITSQVIVSSANGATSTLAQTTIRSSTVDSVTSSASGAVQRVDDTTVSNMLDLEDVFIGTGTDTRVFLTRVTVENNILDERWRVLNIRDGAQGRADETTISRNTNLQFAFTASSSRSVLVIDDSFLTNNFGLGVSGQFAGHLAIVFPFISNVFTSSCSEIQQVLLSLGYKELLFRLNALFLMVTTLLR
jgi:hypothetical protein